MIVKQFRYYGDNYTLQYLNAPSNVTIEELKGGVLFNRITCNEIKIRTFPGAVVYVNGEDVVVGSNGIYEILERENMTISSVRLDEETANLLQENADLFFVITFIQSK